MNLTARASGAPIKRWGRTAAALAAVALALAACGSSSSATSSSTSGAGAKGLKIAYLTAGSADTFLTTENAATLATAKAAGASIETFDPALNPTTQYDEMANVLAGGKFNAIILAPISAQIMCPLVKQAIAKGIQVVTTIDPVCDLTYASGAASWYPGTLQAVTAQTPVWWNAYFKYIASANPDGGQVAVFTGPSILTLTVNTNAAVKKEFTGTNLSVVASPAGDYTSATAFTMATDVFKAHPDLKVVVSNYSGMTQGIVEAAKQAGLLGKLRIYDVGGTKQALQMVADGTLAMTAPLDPTAFGSLPVTALVDHAEGKPVPHEVEPVYPPQFITQSNYQKFESESY